MNKQATHRVTVLGAVEEPGTYELPTGASNVATALAAAKGLTEEAGTTVQVMRRRDKPTLFAQQPGEQGNAAGVQPVAYNQPAGVPGPYPAQAFAPPPPGLSSPPAVERIDLAMVSTDDQPKADQQLSDRDVVMVMPRLPRFVHVTGLVNQPDRFVLPVNQDIRVLDAVAMAGGVTTPMADKVLVIRQPEGDRQEPAVIEVSLADAKIDGRENLILTAGDLVTVESTPATTAAEMLKSFFRVSLGITQSAFGF